MAVLLKMESTCSKQDLQHNCHLPNYNRILKLSHERLQILSYQVVHWATVSVGTNKHAVILRKPTNKIANKASKLAGRNGHKLTKRRIDLTNVDFLNVIQKVAELWISQSGCQLNTLVAIAFLKML